MSTSPPKIDNAPGLSWRLRKAGWEARWRARGDLIERGYAFKYLNLWCGLEPTEAERGYIAMRCNELQNEMLVWGRGGIPIVTPKFDQMLGGLIDCYQTDIDSPYKKLRYRTRLYYDSLCKALRRIEWKDENGNLCIGATTKIQDIKARTLLRWHEIYVSAGHIAMGHAVMGMLRILSGFGTTLLEDAECARLSTVLGNMRFQMAKARKSILTAEQAIAVCAEAHELGKPSIALAQAFQFECTFRQKDVIGEWVPMNEPGLSLVTDGNNKWLRGIDWKEIDENFVLTHITSKRQKEIIIDLKSAGMVMEELSNKSRDQFPKSGPIIISEASGIPWYQVEFRRNWRLAADAAGVPKSVKNMDTRAGAITEALNAGAPIEKVRKSATHSNQSTTSNYSRGDAEATADVMRIRAESRQNKA